MAINRKIKHGLFLSATTIEAKTGFTNEDAGRIFVSGERGREGIYIVSKLKYDDDGNLIKGDNGEKALIDGVEHPVRISTDETLELAPRKMGSDITVALTADSGYTFSTSSAATLQKVISAIGETVLKNEKKADDANSRLNDSLSAYVVTSSLTIDNPSISGYTIKQGGNEILSFSAIDIHPSSIEIGEDDSKAKFIKISMTDGNSISVALSGIVSGSGFISMDDKNVLSLTTGAVSSETSGLAINTDVKNELSNYKIKSAATGTNTTLSLSDNGVLSINANGTSASAANKDTDLALAKELWTLSGAVTGISADTKFTGAITGITAGNSYVSVEANETNATNAKKISAQVSMLTATTLTATGKLADAKDVKDYVDKQVKASSITGAAGDTNYINAELKDNKITVSAITDSTSADNPTGLATAADAKVTLASSTNDGITTYTLSQGGKSYTFNIDKERYIQTGAVKTVTTVNSPYSGAKVGDYYIDLEIIGTGDPNSHLYIPANSLVDDLTINNDSSSYLEIKNRQLAAKTGDGGLATYAHVTTLSGNVVTALGNKANTADYHVKSGAAGTNTTAAITNGTLSFSATGTAVASVTEANKSTALALADELKTLSGKVENIKIPTVPVSSVTGENYIIATTTDGKVTVKAVTAAISSTDTTGLVLNTDVNALSETIKAAIDEKADASAIPSVPVTSITGDNTYISATTSDKTVAVNAISASVSSTTTTGLATNTDVKTYVDDAVSGAITSVTINGITATTENKISCLNLPTFSGATSTENGTSGLVPAPTTADGNSFLRGDGTWTKIDFENKGITSLEFVEEISDASASSAQTGPCIVKWLKAGTSVQISIDAIDGGDY